MTHLWLPTPNHRLHASLNGSTKSIPPRLAKAGGFTLIELLITTALSSILLLGATSMFMIFMTSNSKTSIRRQINQEGQQALSSIEFKLRNALKVTSACTGSATNNITYQNLSGIPQKLAVEDDFITYDENNDGDPSALHSEYVVANDTIFTCTQDSQSGKQSVKVDFTLRNTDGTIPQVYQTTIDIRNTGQ